MYAAQGFRYIKLFDLFDFMVSLQRDVRKLLGL